MDLLRRCARTSTIGATLVIAAHALLACGSEDSGGDEGAGGDATQTSGGVTSGPGAAGSGGGTTGGGEGGAATACQEIGGRLCEHACDCTTDGCRIAASSGPATASVRFEDLAECLDVLVDVRCSGGGEPVNDIEACREHLSTPTCVDAQMDQAALIPDACQTPD